MDNFTTVDSRMANSISFNMVDIKVKALILPLLVTIKIELLTH